MKKLSLIDFFCGAGGFSEDFVRAILNPVTRV